MAAKFIKPAREFELKVSETNVLVAFVNYANKDTHLGWPSVKRLCWDTGMSRRAVQYALAHLEELGILIKAKDATPTFPAVYAFNPHADAPRKPEYKPDERVQEMHPLDDERVQKLHERVQEVHPGGARDAPKPLLNRNEPSAAACAAHIFEDRKVGTRVFRICPTCGEKDTAA